MTAAYVLKAQNPSTQEWVELARIEVTSDYQNRKAGKRAVEEASRIAPGWLLTWELELSSK